MYNLFSILSVSAPPQSTAAPVATTASPTMSASLRTDAVGATNTADSAGTYLYVLVLCYLFRFLAYSLNWLHVHFQYRKCDFR